MMKRDFWDGKYGPDTFFFGEAPNHFLMSQAEYLAAPGRAFVPGDGEGRNGVWLAENGLSVTTVDLSSVGVEKANSLASRRGVTLDAQQANLMNYDWPTDSWDVVALVWLHMPTDLRHAVHQGVWRGLAPGGIILVEAYRPEHVAYRKKYGSRGGPPTGEHMMTAAILEDDFSAGVFELLEESDVVLDEGEGHTGRSAVLRARIRKPAS